VCVRAISYGAVYVYCIAPKVMIPYNRLL
jgi:hypothetical protein